MKASAPVLAVSQLAAGHSERPLLSDISFSVQPGHMVTLIGPNGAGKTTLLRTIAGQLAPLAGTVQILGRDIRTMSEAEQARVRAALFTRLPHTELLTCYDMVSSGRYPYTGRLGTLGARDREIVRETMEATDVWRLRARDFAHMSDGQRQRALIARALCQEPALLLLDEPTSYLDIRSQIAMLELLRRLARERGLAVLASLHDIALALRASDWIVSVRDGSIMRQGAPCEVFTSDAMAALYNIDGTSFSPAFGTIELARTPGAPAALVLAGGNNAADTFRSLQRAGVPFAVVAPHATDIDTALAQSLAQTVIALDSYEHVDDACARAEALLKQCGTLICLDQATMLGARAADRLTAKAHAVGMPCLSSARELLI